MPMTLLRGVRWAGAPIIGALVALVIQVVVYRATLELLGATVGTPSGEWIWAAKAFTSLFMGAAFVAAVWWVAPAAKPRTASVALFVVALWGGRLIFSGLGDSGSVWLVAMGALGILGGTVTFWAARGLRGASA